MPRAGFGWARTPPPLYRSRLLPVESRRDSGPDAIKQAGVDDNTIVVLSSDNGNGGMVGAANLVPKDSLIDGIDASAFTLGKSNATGRDSYMFFDPDGELMSIKWKIYKVILRYSEGVDKPIVKPQFPMFYDLSSDPHEDWNLFRVSTRIDRIAQAALLPPTAGNADNTAGEAGAVVAVVGVVLADGAGSSPSNALIGRSIKANGSH